MAPNSLQNLAIETYELQNVADVHAVSATEAFWDRTGSWKHNSTHFVMAEDDNNIPSRLDLQVAASIT
jgi:hypothetical protein